MQQLPAQSTYSRCLAGCGHQMPYFRNGPVTDAASGGYILMSSDPNLDTYMYATFQPTQRVKKTGAGHCRVAKRSIGKGNRLANTVVQSVQEKSMEVRRRGLNKELKATQSSTEAAK